MKNYFSYWYKRTIKDGLKAIKYVIGIGLSAALMDSVNIIVGIMFFGWVLVESLIEKE